MRDSQAHPASQDRAATPSGPSQSSVVSGIAGIPCACVKCGDASVRVLVEGEPLCTKHMIEWGVEETRLAREESICRVMQALDSAADVETSAPWEQHLRRMAEAAVDAM